MTYIINGKEIADKKLGNLKQKLLGMKSIPGLAIILVGNNPSSEVYVKNKIKAAENIGISAKLIKLPQDITTLRLISKITELNNDDSIHGIIVQLPLPKHINNFEIISTISPRKDIDGFHPLNVGMLYAGQKPFFSPCTPLGIIDLLKNFVINLSGLHAVIIGRSNIVGKPLASLLLKEDATVTICHSKTRELKEFTRRADIIISASGQMLEFGRDYFSEKSVIIDVGINRTQEGKVVGDVLFEEVNGFVKACTRVPGGVGPMTVASLMENLVIAFQNS